MVAWVVIDRQHLRQTSPSLFPCSHSHFGCHASRIPEEIIPFFSCTYVEPILQLFYFQSIPHSLQKTTRGGGSEVSLLTGFNSLINALDSFNHALAIPIESRHEESAPPFQHCPAARTRGRFYGHGAGPARMCNLRTHFGGSEENGEGRHLRLYREPQEARGAHPDRRRNVGYLSGSRVCRDCPPLSRARSSNPSGSARTGNRSSDLFPSRLCELCVLSDLCVNSVSFFQLSTFNFKPLPPVTSHQSPVTNHESPVTLLLPLLTFHRISSQMVIPKETASLDRTTNEHPRRHYRQAHQDHRRTRRANRRPRRHTHLRPGCAQFRCLRPGSRSQLVDSSRPSRRAVHHSHQRGHHYATGHRLLFVSPDDRRLSDRRRLLYRRALKPGRLRRPSRGRGFADGLYSHRGRGHFRGRWCAGLRRSLAAAAYRGPLRRDSYCHHDSESARRPRSGRSLHGADVSLRRHAANHYCWRAPPRRPQRWTSCAGDSSAAPAGHDRSRHVVAPAESFRQRLHCADRRRSRQQWREGLSRACGEKRAARADGHHFSVGCSAGGNFVSRQSLRHRGD